eukprot:1733603-Prymnesium_polylepis.2
MGRLLVVDSRVRLMRSVSAFVDRRRLVEEVESSATEHGELSTQMCVSTARRSCSISRGSVRLAICSCTLTSETKPTVGVTAAVSCSDDVRAASVEACTELDNVD